MLSLLLPSVSMLSLSYTAMQLLKYFVQKLPPQQGLLSRAWRLLEPGDIHSYLQQSCWIASMLTGVTNEEVMKCSHVLEARRHQHQNYQSQLFGFQPPIFKGILLLSSAARTHACGQSPVLTFLVRSENDLCMSFSTATLCLPWNRLLYTRLD